MEEGGKGDKEGKVWSDKERKKDQTEETYLVCSPIASLEPLQLFDHFRKGVTQPLVTQSLTPLSIGPESMDQPPSKKNREKLHDILNPCSPSVSVPVPVF